MIFTKFTPEEDERLLREAAIGTPYGRVAAMMNRHSKHIIARYYVIMKRKQIQPDSEAVIADRLAMLLAGWPAGVSSREARYLIQIESGEIRTLKQLQKEAGKSLAARMTFEQWVEIDSRGRVLIPAITQMLRRRRLGLDRDV